VKRYYKNGVNIVFDGYTDNATKSKKSVERYLKAIRYGPANLLFDDTMCVSMF